MSDEKQPEQTPPWITDLYAQSREQPPEALDAAVLGEAKAAVRQGKTKAQRTRLFRKPWVSGLASAAVVLLTVGVMFIGRPEPVAVLPAVESPPAPQSVPLLDKVAADQASPKASTKEDSFAGAAEPARMRLMQREAMSIANSETQLTTCDAVSEGFCSDAVGLMIKSPDCSTGLRLPVTAQIDDAGATYRLGAQKMRAICIAGEWQVQGENDAPQE